MGLGRLDWKEALGAGSVCRKNICHQQDATPASGMMCYRAHLGHEGCPSSAVLLVSVGLALSVVKGSQGSRAGEHPAALAVMSSTFSTSIFSNSENKVNSCKSRGLSPTPLLSGMWRLAWLTYGLGL